MKAFSILVSCSVLGIATHAQAQTSPQTPSPSAPAGTSDTGQQVPGDEPSPENTADRDSVTNIVVTANRREERLQEVPVTVTLVDGAQLTRQNINAVEDLTRTAPALNVVGPPGGGAVSIRGIGGVSFSQSAEGSVGVVVDGVSLANTSINPPLLFDVSRVEVLEGPQGTLFGRNSSAGVVNVVTNAPDPSRVEVIGHADIGTNNNYITRAALNLPVSSNAALRVAGSFSQEPQTQRNLFDGTYLKRQAKAGRARFLWEPTDRLTVNLGADYTDTDTNGGVPWVVYSSSPTSPLTARLNACGVDVRARNDEGCVNAGNKGSITTYGFSGQVDLDLGGPTLTSITALRRVRSNTSAQDADATSADRLFQTIRTGSNNFSQELRVSSSSSEAVEYVGGLFYFRSTQDYFQSQIGQVLADLPLIGACPLPAATLCSLSFGQTRPIATRVESYAAFGQATIHATNRLRVILGARVGREDLRAVSGAGATAPGAFAPFITFEALSANPKDTYFSYRVGAQYDVTRDLMVFATYTRGYKGAAVNDGATTAAVPLVVRPEIPKSGEIGFKATLAGGRAALNATAFYTKVEDFQAQFFDPSAGGAFLFGNAPKLTSKGVSANLFGTLSRALVANVGVVYNDTSYGAGYAIPNFQNVPTSAEGRQLVGAPKWKVTASAEYGTPLTGSVDAFAQADVVYTSRRYSDATNDPVAAIDAAAIFGGRIGVRTSDRRFGVSVFARNLFDTFRPAARFATPVAQQQLDPLSLSQFVGAEAKRTVGLSLDARF
ncbi:TonB-dependent receptor [Sphingomonas sp. PL-96]|uniref:TonB-dependent receptor n=1 Tax=Sphingomonas sp. PL-96 TaxID=2887201 RepID=UPI001E3DC070|nr:TonB-dependent receptor [Sphingomonas sp. PL-96]MCC2978251.1 TonB-dependent receptor [Sphingomonas sp. PL-96]